MIILAIDPAPIESGWVLWDTEEQKPAHCGINDNAYLRESIVTQELKYPVYSHYDIFACEMIANMGMAAGASLFETAREIGRFQDRASQRINESKIFLPKRNQIKLHLCGSARAKDPNVSQALRDRYGEKGTKKNPGKLYGVKSHIWSALAVAVYTQDVLLKEKI